MTADALENYDLHRREPVAMGRMTDPDGIGNVGSIVVGRALRFFLKLEGDRVSEARFQVFACSEQLPVASRLCELVVGLTVAEAAALSVADVRAAFGDLPVDHLPVVSWPLIALRQALAAARGEEPPLREDEVRGELLCRCFGVTRATVVETIAELETPELDELMAATAAGTGCGTCRRDLTALLEEAGTSAAPAPAPGGGKGRIALLKRIEAIAGPLLAESDGALELWSVEGATLVLRARGDQDPALLTRLEMALRDEVDPTLKVSLRSD